MGQIIIFTVLYRLSIVLSSSEDQLKIAFRRSYEGMKQRVAAINFPDTTSCSTNFSVFLEWVESEDTKWISTIQKYLREQE